MEFVLEIALMHMSKGRYLGSKIRKVLGRLQVFVFVNY
jgi:hypothetical protein